MNLRFISMTTVLFVAVVLGYFFGTRIERTEILAKKIMTFVMVAFSWPISFLIVWKMNLSLDLVYLPVICGALILIMTILSSIVFFFYKLPFESHATMTLAGGLSNMGYTGGGFICYALFGLAGLGMSQIYIIAVPIVVYMIFVPVIRVIQTKTLKSSLSLPKMFFDYRLISLPVIIFAIILNLSSTKPTEWIFTSHFVDILIYIAAAAAFFAIGIRLNLAHLRNYINMHLMLAVIKFLLAPMVAIMLLWFLKQTGHGLQPLARNIVIVQALTPTAVMMVVLSNIFNFNSRLASAVWVTNTTIFMVAIMPILYFVFI